ncbi:hypothetical protein KAR91_58595 [Candidatus Pacearchaeota archaeon]|nr:hypothetical protein [Candidatus Pacearchaeota archaeon]
MGKRTPKKKKPVKILHKTKDEWVESISTHISKFIDRMSTDDAIGIAIGSWAAFALKDPWMFLPGIVAYRMARTDGLISQGAGVASLAMLGLASMDNIVANPIPTPDTHKWYQETKGSVPYHHWRRWKDEHPDEVWPY